MINGRVVNGRGEGDYKIEREIGGLGVRGLNRHRYGERNLGLWI